MELRGKRALITGASSGIGAEFARQLHGLGVSLILVARREPELKALAEKLNASAPGTVSYLRCDIGRRDDPGFEKVLELACSGDIDILINNAGRGSFDYFEKLSLEEEVQMVELNVLGYLRLSHAVIPAMKARRSGAIVHVSSVAGFQPLPYMATYGATKAFNLSHSVALREELRPFGVGVLAVCPGPVDTEFAGVARVPGEWTGIGRDRVEDVVAQSIAALRRNKDFVVPCLRSRLLSLPSRLLPFWLTCKVTANVLRGALMKK